MWGHYSARGQIGTVTVQAALAGPAWALHSIVGWVEVAMFSLSGFDRFKICVAFLFIS